MDFQLTKEQQMLRKMYREFAETEVKPLAQEIDEEERFPSETIPKLARYGFLGIPFEKKYGGQGGTNMAYAMAIEEIAKVCGTTSVIIAAHTSLCCNPIHDWGTEEQKMKYLPDLLSGRKLGAFGLTEPGAGSDASGQQTTAVLEGDHYVLNGTKCFITNASEASTFVVFAMKFSDVDYWEINEAFAAQFLGVGRKLKEECGYDIDLNRTNVNGSGISLGHPVGCSALRIIVTMLYEMKRRDYKIGCASLCVGGGPAMASLWTRNF